MASRTCPRCRATVPEPTAVVCWECGTTLEPAAASPSAFAAAAAAATPRAAGAGVERGWRPPPLLAGAGLLAVLAVGVWILLLRPDDGRLPGRLGERERLAVADGAEARRELAGLARLGIADAELATYGSGGVEVVVFTGTVQGSFDFEGFLRSVAAFGGSRVSFAPLAGPPGWSCRTAQGSRPVFEGVGSLEASLCHRIQGSSLLAFAAVPGVDPAAVVADLG